MSQMNPKKFLHNTTFSVQLQYNFRSLPLRQKLCSFDLNLDPQFHNTKVFNFGKFQRNMFHGFEDFWVPPDPTENVYQTTKPTFSSLNLPSHWPYSGQLLDTESGRSPRNEPESLNLNSEIMVFTQDHKLRKHYQKHYLRDCHGAA